MTPMHTLTGALNPALSSSVFTSSAANEPAASPPDNAARPVPLADAHVPDTPRQWSDHVIERRVAADQWRRTLQRLGSHTSHDTAPPPDPPLSLNDRLLNLTQVWRDAVRKFPSFTAQEPRRSGCDSASCALARLQAAVYRNVLTQMTPLVGTQVAHDSAQETSMLVAIARRVDEIDAWIEAKGLRNTPADLLEQRNVMTAALVNHDVYFDEAVPHILPSRVQRQRHFDHNGSGQSGYFGAVYSDALGDRLIVANRGTEMGVAGRSGVDWKENIRQALGLETPQYNEAINLAKSLAMEHAPSKLVFTGHSLGGGLASAQASVVPGSKGLTFDTAGLHNRTVARHSATPASTRVKAYHIHGEALSIVQDAMKGAESLALHIPLVRKAVSWLTRMALPRPVGERIGVPLATPAQPRAGRHPLPIPDDDPSTASGISGISGIRGAIEKHSMVQMIHSLFDRLPKQRLSRDETHPMQRATG